MSYPDGSDHGRSWQGKIYIEFLTWLQLMVSCCSRNIDSVWQHLPASGRFVIADTLIFFRPFELTWNSVIYPFRWDPFSSSATASLRSTPPPPMAIAVVPIDFLLYAVAALLYSTPPFFAGFYLFLPLYLARFCRMMPEKPSQKPPASRKRAVTSLALVINAAFCLPAASGALVKCATSGDAGR